MTEQKLRELFESLSLEEKLGEVWQVENAAFDANGVVTGDIAQNSDSSQYIYLTGSTLNLFGYDRIRGVQENHIQNHPHHIPMLFMADIIHGHTTVLPDPLASSCSFDMDKIKTAFQMVAKESAVSGLHITFYPMIDLSRDPRWGRVVESAGEDPYLSSQVCKAIVEGLQGDGLQDPLTIGACIKHFAGYGASEGGRDYNAVDLSERDLRNYYLKGYKGGLDAGAVMVMTSFNTIGGVPSTSNKWLLRTLLKDEWGFDGVVITDIWTIGSIERCRIGEDGEFDHQYRVEKSFEAGVDISMVAKPFALKKSIEQGRFDETVIDEACWRVLKLKNKLGLFENPYRGMLATEEAAKVLLCDEHLAIAKELALESPVLLKNTDRALPLNAGEKIAFIGPFVEKTEVNGSWVFVGNDVKTTLTEELKKRYPTADFTFAKGCSALGREDGHMAELYGNCDEDTREQTIAQAVEIAKGMDTVVLVLGEIQDIFGEGKSRANIKLPAVQLELYRRVRAVANKVVVLLQNGRPLDLTEIQDADAILETWYLGTTMHETVVDLLFGKTSPSGRLTMSFPKNAGHIPVYYNCLPTDHPVGKVGGYNTCYIDEGAPEPRYPFGYGLTYSTVEYGQTTVDKEVFGVDDIVTVSAEITNTGDRDIVEVAQLYVRDYRATVSLPEKELKGFKRVAIKAGETVKVAFALTEEMLRYYNVDMEYTSDAGRFDVLIAPHSGFDSNKDMLAIRLEK